MRWLLLLFAFYFSGCGYCDFPEDLLPWNIHNACWSRDYSPPPALSVQFRIVDATEDTGLYSAIVIDRGGLPVLTYQNQKKELKLASLLPDGTWKLSQFANIAVAPKAAKMFVDAQGEVHSVAVADNPGIFFDAFVAKDNPQIVTDTVDKEIATFAVLPDLNEDGLHRLYSESVSGGLTYNYLPGSDTSFATRITVHTAYNADPLWDLCLARNGRGNDLRAVFVESGTRQLVLLRIEPASQFAPVRMEYQSAGLVLLPYASAASGHTLDCVADRTLLHVSYIEGKDNTLRYLTIDATGNSGAVENVTNATNALNLILDNNDVPTLVFRDEVGKNLVIAVRTWSQGWRNASLDLGGNVGSDPDTVALQNGQVAISYRDFSRRALKFAIITVY